MAQKKVLILSDGDLADLLQPLVKSVKMRNLPLPGGMDEISSFKPHLIILEIGKPADLNICKEIRKTSLSIPIIVVDEKKGENAVWAFRYGAWDYLKRPLTADLLKKTAVPLVSTDSAPLTREEYLQYAWGERSPLEPPLQLKVVLGYLDENMESAITLDDMSRMAHMSKYHFCRTFRRYIHVSPVHYLHRLRVDRAKLLISKDVLKSITDVAVATGYGNVSQFDRMFRKVTGLSPGQYRKIYSTITTPQRKVVSGRE